MPSNVSRDQGSSLFSGIKGRNLLVNCPHGNSFVIIENREIHRTSNVIFGILCGCPHIDDFIECGKVGREDNALGFSAHQWECSTPDIGGVTANLTQNWHKNAEISVTTRGS
jgi:hypothetical protein